MWADGVHPKVRLGQAHSCVPVLLGVRLDGTKELIALTERLRESTESWADLPRDRRHPDMRNPELVVGDGRMGLRHPGRVRGGGMTRGPAPIAVSGPTSADKTALAHGLADALSWPAVRRDKIKKDMAAAGADPADHLDLKTLKAFFRTIGELLQSGTSLITEAAFQDRPWCPLACIIAAREKIAPTGEERPLEGAERCRFRALFPTR